MVDRVKALEDAVILTECALQASVRHAQGALAVEYGGKAAEFLETVYLKLVELQEAGEEPPGSANDR